MKRIADACKAAGVKYEFKMLKSGFVVCFYRLGEKTHESTDKMVKSTDKVRVNTDNLNAAQKKIIDYM